jgi:CBS domain-containing protein
MKDLRVANVLREVPALSPQDTVARGLTLLRRHGLPALAVAWEGRPVGMFSEAGLLVQAQPEAGQHAGEALRNLPIGQVMTPVPAFVHPGMKLLDLVDNGNEQDAGPIGAIVNALRAHHNTCLPVVDDTGYYLGLLSRQEVLTALCGVASPGSVGGMATPLGVHLTNGVVSAGPGDAGLFLTGAAMTALLLLAVVIVNGLCWLVQRYTSLPLLAISLSGATPSGAMYFPHADIWQSAINVLQFASFFILMRLSPLAATHGAEHMVVHAIEAGEELTPEKVMAHTTVHPRCGTNLAAMMMVIAAGTLYITSTSKLNAWNLSMAVVIITIIALLLRQRIGGVLQWLLTTRRPSEKRIMAAIKVGEELLERCQLHATQKRTLAKRIWNIGLLQVMAGAIVIGYPLQWLLERFLGLHF